MPEFNVTLTVTGRISMDVEAETEEEAVKLAEGSWRDDDLLDLHQDGAAKVRETK